MAMDPVRPVSQLAVAAISGAAFLISIVVIPMPDSKGDPSAGIASTLDSVVRLLDTSSNPPIKQFLGSAFRDGGSVQQRDP